MVMMVVSGLAREKSYSINQPGSCKLAEHDSNVV